MKNGLAALLIVALAFSVIFIRAYDARAQRPEAQGEKASPSQEQTSLWMKHKLAATQKILEGMTREDYELMEKNAKDMHVMGFLEGAVRAGVPEYKAQLRAFDHALGAIIRESQEKNLDGVTIAYTQLTISCVQCHKVIRDRLTQ